MTMDRYSNLIEKIKLGNEEAYNDLLDIHKKMIYKIIYSENLFIGDYMIDIDSLYQEGCITLYKAVFDYQEEKGMTFSSYAYMVIRARIKTCIRNDKASNAECYSLEDYNNVDHQTAFINMCVSENPIEYHREIEFEKRLNSFVSNLSDEDRQIFELRGDDCSYKQISERLKINTKRVDNRLRVLRKKLKEYIDE